MAANLTYAPDRPLCMFARSCIVPPPCNHALLHQVAILFFGEAHTP